MRWTYPLLRWPSWVSCLLSLFLFCQPTLLRAQGQVADSTELRILRQLYVSTKGDQWSKRTNWPTSQAWPSTATSADFGTWTGVQVTNGDITSLDLNASALQGTLSPSLGLLTSLTFLHVGNNPGLTGTLPATLGQLRELRYLRTSHSPLSGELPAQLAQLTKLEYLTLDDSRFSGSIPTWVGSLSSLLFLTLNDNRFTGPIPAEIGQLTKLIGLDLSNSFGGQPGQGNVLTGPIPPALGQLTNLNILYLSRNPLTGTIPPTLGQLKRLNFVELDGCRLSGAVPTEIAQLPLYTLVLGYNYPYPYYTDHNTFTSLPAPSAFPRLASTTLLVGDNQLEFGTLEPFFSGRGQHRAGSDSRFLPQTLAQDAQTIQVEAGQAVNVASAIGGSRTRYQWQRQVGGKWINQTSPSATTATYQLTAVALSDAGTYRCRATNDWVIDLTLTTRVYTLDVRERGPRNLPDDTNRGLALATPPAAPDAAATKPADMNYVRTWLPQVPLTTLEAQGTETAIALPNPGFEQEQANVDLPTGWRVVTGPGTDSHANSTEGNPPAHSGNYHGTHYRPYNPAAYDYFDVYTYQTVSNLPNGRYRVGAWVRSNDGHSPSVLRVQNYGGPRREMGLPNQSGAAIATWTYLELTDVLVTNGTCEIGFYSHALGGQAFFFDDVTLVRQADAVQAGTTVAQTLPGGLLREQWDGVPGTGVSDIPLTTTPTTTQYLTALEGPQDVGDRYGARLRGYLLPPVSGDYTFWIAGDDNCELWLSSDADPAHKQRLAYVPEWTGWHEFDKFAQQQSVLVPLLAGQRYYLEVLHKEDTGGDNLTVAWTIPASSQGPATYQAPIPGAYLAPLQVPASGVVVREQWDNVPGTAVSDIPLTTPPTSQAYLTSLEAPIAVGDRYGARIRGYLIAPQTGAYRFWIAGDDNGEFWLSPDADPTHKLRRASVPGWTSPREWTKYADQESAEIQLVAGQRYYLEILHKEDLEGDHVAVSWRLPDGSVYQEPVPGRHLAPYVPTPAALAVEAAPTWTVDQAQRTTQYLDGLGRPVQLVRHEASPQRRDLVQPQAYDALGREPRQYLPYAADTDSAVVANHVGPHGYRYQALNDQQQYYGRTTAAGGSPGPLDLTDPTRGVARTGAAYAESLFEASPLNRVLQQGAPGEAWQLSQGHAQQRLERPNTAADSVLRFQPGYDPKSLDPGYQGYYAPGELWGIQVADEHGSRSLEWKDKLGQVVLKQVEASRPDTSRLAPRRWLRTAYAYDDFQRLRFVLQPEGTGRLVAGAALPALTSFLFHYRYDGRGRQIAKQVPGQDGETLVVYDQLDRPVLSQDAQQRTRREWSWTKYDALGRVVLSGLVTRQDTMSQVTLQAVATADTATAHQYEQRTTSSATQFYTASQSFPQLGQQGFSAGQVLTATYYDDYDFDNNGQPDAAYDPQSDGQFPSGQAPVADALRTQGMSTRTKTRVLGVAENDATQAAWLTTTTFYDERARPVQVQTTNARKGTDLLTTQLDFTGKVVQSVALHQGPGLVTPLQVAEFFSYDHTGRLLSTRQQLPGEAQPSQVAAMSYNELGQVTRKTLGTGRLTQQVDYAYNIRGWLTSLNDPAQPNPTKNDLFHLSLHYEMGFTKGYEQYNGNLTGQTWRGRDGVQRAYGYVYDPLNRLLQGDFVARAGGSQGTLNSATAWNQELDNYRLSFVSYDDNGNINTLRRQGLLQNATSKRAKQYGAVDNLSYAYVGNRLQAVNDAVTGNQLAQPTSYHGAPTSLAGDFQEARVKLRQEYDYDANGNLTADKNKGITGIAYNHLNLPRQIHFGQVGDSVVFRYTASGQKVAKLVYQTGKPLNRTDYLGPYQYEQDSLKFFPHAEGRVLRFVSYDAANQPRVSYQREYTVKDHLGNLRLAYRAGQVRTLTAGLELDQPTVHQRETQQFDSLSVSAPIAQSVGTLVARTGSHVALLNASGAVPHPLGPLTQLTVQKGDSIRALAFGYYPQPVSNNSFGFSLASFVAGLLQPAPAGQPAGPDGRRRGGLPLLQIGLGAGLATLPQLRDDAPKGYLRVLIFNEDSVLVESRTLQLTPTAHNGYDSLRTGYLPIRQNGYVTVYVGNESPVDVYFDDISIEHRQGLQVQENQYDPYGLDLAGVSGTAPGLRLKNFYQFNGKENQLDLGLNWNHQDWRYFDYQIGRWHVVDPEIENAQESWGPYSFGFDNAVRYADVNGRAPGEGEEPSIKRGVLQGAVDFAVGSVSNTGAVGIGALTSIGQNLATGNYTEAALGAATILSPGLGLAQQGLAFVKGNSETKARIATQIGLTIVASAVTERIAGKAAATPCGCFTAGTGISTRRGRKLIEQVQVGDSVWAYNERTRQTALRPVTHLFRYERDTVYVLHTATGEALRTTSDHPFYVRGQWVRVKRLRVGDSLVSQSGQRHVLRRIDRQPEHVTVYNFTVDELHTYFVGQNAILVHNSGPCPVGGAYKDLDVTSSQHRHHMPSNASSPLSKGKGPSVTMEATDHVKTASYGSGTAAKAYRAQQKALIDSGNFNGAMEMDVKNVRSLFGSKYDAGIKQAKDYYNSTLKATNP